ncbi:MAG: ATP:cob(I)alamin adenosyltransferase [Actinomycetota bacterium]|jgi:hypothetical protein|nr:ATP:cob(I)alamin adenosyltransferase [Actinomycetota bacterium]
MVAEVEARTDEAALRFLCSPTSSCPARTGWPPSSTSAARLVRQAVAVAAPGSSILPYLNRLSSLLWALARAEDAEADGTVRAKDVEPSGRR